MKKELAAGKAQGVGDDSPFELFVSSTNIRYSYYKELDRLHGLTANLLILADFEAISPNVLARTVEIVSGGGLVVLLLKDLPSLQHLYTLSMDAHARYTTEGSGAVRPRFNERFLLSLAACPAALLLDERLTVLPMSQSRVPASLALPSPDVLAARRAQDGKVLADLVARFVDEEPIGPLLRLARTVDQGRALLSFIEAAADRTPRATVALTSGRGRGKSATLGLSIAAAVAYGFSNIFVTSPAVDNVQTLFDFVVLGLQALGLTVGDHFAISREGTSSGGVKLATGLITRINVYKSHRQTVRYISPADAATLSHAELLVIDEAAAIPLPLVKAALGEHLVFLASTVSGYEGTGRALSLKLLKQMRRAQHEATAAGETVGSGDGSARKLTEITLTEPIRYGSGDPVERWLNDLLCLEAEKHLPESPPCPAPRDCQLFHVCRDTLFSGHASAERFLLGITGLFVSSHYKNSPNDLQLLADAPNHHIFVLTSPVTSATSNALPTVLVAIQVAIEGSLSLSSVRQSARGSFAPHGDLIPWTLSQQLGDERFPTLSGARIVRIATHPRAERMGFASRAMALLTSYYADGTATVAEAAASTQAVPVAKPSNSLLDVPKPRSSLPPLLTSLADRPAEALDWLGTAYGLTLDLFRFWRTRVHMTPLYISLTPNATTGEYTAICLRSLNRAGASSPDWLAKFSADVRRRIIQNLGGEHRRLPTDLAVSLLRSAAFESAVGKVVDRSADLLPERLAVNADAATTTTSSSSRPPVTPAAAAAAVAGSFGLTLHDMARLDRYAAGRADYRLVADLTPRLADYFFRGAFDDSALSLAPSQEGALAAIGLQRKSMAEYAADAGLEVPQATALFGKTMRRLARCLGALMEERAGEASGVEEEAKLAAAVADTMQPVSGRLDTELADEAASLTAKERRRRQAAANELLGRAFEVSDEAGAELARVAATAAAEGTDMPDTVSVASTEIRRKPSKRDKKSSSKKSKKRGRD